MENKKFVPRTKQLEHLNKRHKNSELKFNLLYVVSAIFWTTQIIVDVYILYYGF